jgi:hypothetical protein
MADTLYIEAKLTTDASASFLAQLLNITSHTPRLLRNILSELFSKGIKIKIKSYVN